MTKRQRKSNIVQEMLSLIKQKRENIHKNPVLAYRFSNPISFIRKATMMRLLFLIDFTTKMLPSKNGWEYFLLINGNREEMAALNLSESNDERQLKAQSPAGNCRHIGSIGNNFHSVAISGKDK